MRAVAKAMMPPRISIISRELTILRADLALTREPAFRPATPSDRRYRGFHSQSNALLHDGEGCFPRGIARWRGGSNREEFRQTMAEKCPRSLMRALRAWRIELRLGQGDATLAGANRGKDKIRERRSARRRKKYRRAQARMAEQDAKSRGLARSQNKRGAAHGPITWRCVRLPVVAAKYACAVAKVAATRAGIARANSSHGTT